MEILKLIRTFKFKFLNIESICKCNLAIRFSNVNEVVEYVAYLTAHGVNTTNIDPYRAFEIHKDRLCIHVCMRYELTPRAYGIIYGDCDDHYKYRNVYRYHKIKLKDL